MKSNSEWSLSQRANSALQGDAQAINILRTKRAFILLLPIPHCLSLRILRAVEVDVLPRAANLLPHASFFKPRRLWSAGSVDRLRKSHVTDYGGVGSDHSHMWRSHRHQFSSCRAAEVKVVLMKRHANDQLAAGFRFEAGDRAIAHSPR